MGTQAGQIESAVARWARWSAGFWSLEDPPSSTTPEPAAVVSYGINQFDQRRQSIKTFRLKRKVGWPADGRVCRSDEALTAVTGEERPQCLRTASVASSMAVACIR